MVWAFTVVLLLLIAGAFFASRVCSGLPAGTAEKLTAGAGADETGYAGRWPLILSSAWVQVIAGSVYAMGAWQDTLRDALGISMSQVATIGAATFLGSLVASLGGMVFDKLGPRASVALGGAICTTGYTLILIAVVIGESVPSSTRLMIAAAGALCAGYSSVSLLDNVVCMACSLSFPKDRAAVVGYLKAVLATAAGLWALLWVHVFQAPHGPGLTAYLMFTAVVSLVSTIFALYPMQVLPDGPARAKFAGPDVSRLAAVIGLAVALSVFNVGVSFLYSRKVIHQLTALGFVGSFLSVTPLFLFLFPAPKAAARDASGADSLASPAAAGASDGISFSTAAKGLDFWLLWFIQFAVFGSGVATNQNLALILESVGSPEAAGLGVALFALASSVSRMVVGILSDKYSHVFSRMNWIQVVAAWAIASQALCATMAFGGVMLGILLAGLSFGVFFTVIVPVVNEMYGRKQFGVIMGSQLASQALASLGICKIMLPAFYARAAQGASVCIGASCFRPSFMLLAALNCACFLASVLLERRNRHSLPVDRLSD